MGKQLKAFPGECPEKRRIDINEENYEYLLHALELVEEDGFIALDMADIDACLKAGEAVFLWESALAANAEEAVAMAKIAAEKMVPAPGHVILGYILHIIGGCCLRFDIVDQIAEQILVLADVDYIINSSICEEQKEKGIRFILATSEGRADTVENNSTNETAS